MYEGTGACFDAVLKQRTELIQENERLKNELQEFKLAMAESEVERELKLAEMAGSANKKKRLITEYFLPP